MAAVVLGLITVALWGSAATAPLLGPPTVLPEDGPSISLSGERQAQSGPPRDPQSPEREADAPWWPTLLFGGVVLVLLGMSATALPRLALQRETGDPGQGELNPTPGEPDVGVEPPSADTLAGHCRNEVVACWVRLEDAASAVGLDPIPTETSAELADRVASRWPEVGPATKDLGRLYRQARFSTHAVGTSQRDEARSVSQEIMEFLFARTDTGR